MQANIIKTAFVNEANMEEAGARKREAPVNTDNSKLFDLANIVCSTPWQWVYAKSAQRTCDGCKALRLIHANQLGPHVIDERNTNNGKAIRGLSYSRERRKHTW